MENEVKELVKQMKQHNEYLKSIKQTLNIFLFIALVIIFLSIASLCITFWPW